MIRDKDRLDSIQDAMRDENLDALVCALPANVLMLSGYWPVIGSSLAIVVPGPRTMLIVPEDESDLAREGCADEVHTFQSTTLEELKTPLEAIRTPLTEAVRRLATRFHRVGFESGGMVEPASYAAMHLYGADILTLLGEAFPGANLIPAEQTLAKLRCVKTPGELERIRQSCRLAAVAFKRGASQLDSGLSEKRAAEQFHGGLADPCGTDPCGRTGGFTWCMSGPNSARASAAYARTEERILASEDLVLVHCNSYAGGYWTDITRTYCLGPGDEYSLRMYSAVFAARAAALEAIRPGRKAAAVDEAARNVFRDRGWAREFKHSTGHGVGFGAISAQAPPRLHPKSDDTLQPGMVFNVEPALYVDGYGGLRHCDMVAVTASGAEVLTPFQTSLDDLLLA